MTRIVALRASIIFVALTLLIGATGVASQTAVLSAVVLIGASVSALLILFAAAPAQPAPIPVRVRHRRIAR
jgi:hypothetical protein